MYRTYCESLSMFEYLDETRKGKIYPDLARARMTPVELDLYGSSTKVGSHREVRKGRSGQDYDGYVVEETSTFGTLVNRVLSD